MNLALLRKLVCCLWLGGAIAQVQAPANLDGERERIARDRAAVGARFSEREADCQHRFAVTDCVNDAKKEQREALAPLRRQANALDDALRKQHAARRLEDVRNRTDTAQAREREAVVREPPTPANRPASAPSGEPATATVRGVKQKPAPRQMTAHTPPKTLSDAERRANEADSQARIEERKRAAMAHRASVEQRNAQRALSGKRADPLPVPASAAAP
jgi:colicin import membrane protein